MRKVIVDYEKTASLDVDAQKCFTIICPLELPVPGGDKIGNECNKNATKAKKRYVSKEAHSKESKWVATLEFPQYSKIKGEMNLDMRWNSHGNVGSIGFELLDELPHPSEYNFIVYKGAEKDMHPYSPVYHDLKKTISTGLIEKAIYDGVDTFIVGGLALNSDMTPLCLGHALIDLSKAGFRVILNLSATAGFGDNSAFLEMLVNVYKIEIVDSADDIITI